MFHPDNIKNKQSGSEISISLHNYWHILGGSKGLAQRLGTNLKVIRFLLNSYLLYLIEWNRRHSLRCEGTSGRLREQHSAHEKDQVAQSANPRMLRR